MSGTRIQGGKASGIRKVFQAFSRANLEGLSREGIKITIPVPSNNLVKKKALKTYGKALRHAKNTFFDGEDDKRGIEETTLCP